MSPALDEFEFVFFLISELEGTFFGPEVDAGFLTGLGAADPAGTLAGAVEGRSAFVTPTLGCFTTSSALSQASLIYNQMISSKTVSIVRDKKVI